MHTHFIRLCIFLYISLTTALPSYAHGNERHDCCDLPSTTDDVKTVESNEMMPEDQDIHGTERNHEVSTPLKNGLQLPHLAPQKTSTFPQGLGEIVFGLIFVFPLGLHIYKYHR